MKGVASCYLLFERGQLSIVSHLHVGRWASLRATRERFGPIAGREALWTAAMGPHQVEFAIRIDIAQGESHAAVIYATERLSAITVRESGVKANQWAAAQRADSSGLKPQKNQLGHMEWGGATPAGPS